MYPGVERISMAPPHRFSPTRPMRSSRLPGSPPKAKPGLLKTQPLSASSQPPPSSVLTKTRFTKNSAPPGTPAWCPTGPSTKRSSANSYRLPGASAVAPSSKRPLTMLPRRPKSSIAYSLLDRAAPQRSLQRDLNELRGSRLNGRYVMLRPTANRPTPISEPQALKTSIT